MIPSLHENILAASASSGAHIAQPTVPCHYFIYLSHPKMEQKKKAHCRSMGSKVRRLKKQLEKFLMAKPTSSEWRRTSCWSYLLNVGRSS